MRRLFNIIFQLVAAAIFFFLCTVAFIVFDGLTDLGGKADVALVTGHAQAGPGASDPLLDRVVQLYNDGEFPFIIVNGSMDGIPTDVTSGSDVFRSSGTLDVAAPMAKYLEDHGVPSNAIIEAHHGDTTQETAGRVAQIMKSHRFQSVIVVTDYYRITRMKLALTHEGIADVGKAHVGTLRKEDALKIGREVVALYAYIGKVYLFPAAEKVKQEAKVGMDKASADAEKAKEKVNKSLDNMAK